MRGVVLALMVMLMLKSAMGLSFTNTTTGLTNAEFLIRPENCIIHNSTLNRYCSIYPNYNISRVLNYSESFNITEINLTLKAPDLGTCSAIPAIIKCQIDQNITPNRGLFNTSFYSYQNEYCDVKFNVSGCESPIRYDIPDGYHLISEEDWTSISTCINDSRECNNERSACLFQKLQCVDEKNDLREMVCPMDLITLLESKHISGFAKENLYKFSKLVEPVSVSEFSDFLTPDSATASQKADIDFWSGIALEQYTKLGFAESRTVTGQIENPRTGLVENVSYLVYTPIISPYCINITSSVIGVYNKGKWHGVRDAGIWALVIATIIFLVWVLQAHVPFFPWR